MKTKKNQAIKVEASFKKEKVGAFNKETNRENPIPSVPSSAIGIFFIAGILADTFAFDIWIPHSNPLVEMAVKAYYYRKAVNPPSFMKLIMIVCILFPLFTLVVSFMFLFSLL